MIRENVPAETAASYIEAQYALLQAQGVDPELIEGLQKRVAFYTTAIDLRRLALMGSIGKDKTSNAHDEGDKNRWRYLEELRDKTPNDARRNDDKMNIGNTPQTPASVDAVLNVLDQWRALRAGDAIQQVEQAQRSAVNTEQNDQAHRDHLDSSFRFQTTTGLVPTEHVVDGNSQTTHHHAEIIHYGENDPWSSTVLDAEAQGFLRLLTEAQTQSQRMEALAVLRESLTDVRDELQRRRDAAASELDQTLFEADNEHLTHHANFLRDGIESVEEMDRRAAWTDDTLIRRTIELRRGLEKRNGAALQTYVIEHLTPALEAAEAEINRRHARQPGMDAAMFKQENSGLLHFADMLDHYRADAVRKLPVVTEELTPAAPPAPLALPVLNDVIPAPAPAATPATRAVMVNGLTLDFNNALDLKTALSDLKTDPLNPRQHLVETLYPLHKAVQAEMEKRKAARPNPASMPSTIALHALEEYVSLRIPQLMDQIDSAKKQTALAATMGVDLGSPESIKEARGIVQRAIKYYDGPQLKQFLVQKLHPLCNAVENELATRRATALNTDAAFLAEHGEGRFQKKFVNDNVALIDFKNYLKAWTRTGLDKAWAETGLDKLTPAAQSSPSKTTDATKSQKEAQANLAGYTGKEMPKPTPQKTESGFFARLAQQAADGARKLGGWARRHLVPVAIGTAATLGTTVFAVSQFGGQNTPKDTTKIAAKAGKSSPAFNDAVMMARVKEKFATTETEPAEGVDVIGEKLKREGLLNDQPKKAASAKRAFKPTSDANYARPVVTLERATMGGKAMSFDTNTYKDVCKKLEPGVTSWICEPKQA